MATVARAAAPAISRTLWNRVSSFPAENPFTFGVVLSGFKTSFSDLLVQKFVEQKEQVDWKRNAAFATFGFLYLGGVQYAIYVPFFGRLFPGAASFAAKSLKDKLKDGRGLFALFAQTFLDQCVHHPLMYFPAFYCTKELVMREKPDISRCLQEYRANMMEDLLALWKVWVPATLFNFAFMPMWARIPTVAMTSLLWTCILSAMRGGDVTHGEEMAGGAVTGATLHMMEEGLEQRQKLFTQPVELAADKAHVVVSAAGHDKIGWVALLSRAVADAGGSITHSKMIRLGTEFLITLHAAVPPEKIRNFAKQLEKNPELKALKVEISSLSRRGTSAQTAPLTGVRLRTVGADQPAMLASVAEALADQQLSIETLSTDIRHGKNENAPHDFVIDADCVANHHLDNLEIHKLVENLNHLKEELSLSTVDIRVQHRAKRED